MLRKYAFLLIVLSVALNIGFAGIWAAQTVAGHWPAWEGCGHEGGDGAVWCPLYRSLAVTDEQRQRLEPRLAQFQQASRTLCQETQHKRAELIDLVAAAETDRTTIRTKQEEILAGQRRMQELVIEQLLTEKEVLTAEQQKELFDMIRRHSGCMGPALMGGGPGKENQLSPRVSPGSSRDGYGGKH